MASAFPSLGTILVHQPQVGLMDQGRGLQRLPGRLLGHPLGGELAQLVVDERQELLRGVRVALLDGAQDSSDFGHRRMQKGR